MGRIVSKSEGILDVMISVVDGNMGRALSVGGVTLTLIGNGKVDVIPTEAPTEGSIAVTPAPVTPAPTRRLKKCASDDDCKRDMTCEEYMGYCVEPTPSPVEEEPGCCMANDEYASSKWKMKCKEAETETLCLRYGRGQQTRCEWKGGYDASCDGDGDDGDNGDNEDTAQCVWNMEGRGDPSKMNRQCGRLDKEECLSGGPKGNCMWIPGEDDDQQLFVDLDGSDDVRDSSILTVIADTLVSFGIVMDQQILLMVAMVVIMALFVLFQLVRRCKQRKGKEYDGYTPIPDTSEEVSSTYFNYMA